MSRFCTSISKNTDDFGSVSLLVLQTCLLGKFHVRLFRGAEVAVSALAGVGKTLSGRRMETPCWIMANYYSRVYTATSLPQL